MGIIIIKIIIFQYKTVCQPTEIYHFPRRKVRKYNMQYCLCVNMTSSKLFMYFFSLYSQAKRAYIKRILIANFSPPFTPEPYHFLLWKMGTFLRSCGRAEFLVVVSFFLFTFLLVCYDEIAQSVTRRKYKEGHDSKAMRTKPTKYAIKHKHSCLLTCFIIMMVHILSYMHPLLIKLQTSLFSKTCLHVKPCILSQCFYTSIIFIHAREHIV